MILSAGRAVHAGGVLRQLSEHAGLGLDCGRDSAACSGTSDHHQTHTVPPNFRSHCSRWDGTHGSWPP